MKVTIGFSTSSLWISRLIRWATRARVSHTFLIIEDGDFGCPMVVQEAWNGFSQQTLSAFKSAGNVVLVVVDPIVPLHTGLAAVAPLLGSSYGYLQLIGAGFVRLARRLGKKNQESNAKHAVALLLGTEHHRASEVRLPRRR